MVSEEVLAEATRRLVERFHPERIILFGSQARGTADKDSDIDLLVVGRFGERHERVARQMSDAIGPLDAPKDIIVMTPEEFARSLRVPGTIARPAAREGHTLYGHTPEPVEEIVDRSNPDIAQFVRIWIGYADEDLQLARDVLDLPRPVYRHSANNAQQAAEKYLKAYLAFRLVDFPKTHNIGKLLDICAERATWPDTLRDSEVLSEYAVTPRYPNILEPAGPRISEADARRAVELAERVRDTVTAALHDEGLAPG